MRPDGARIAGSILAALLTCSPASGETPAPVRTDSSARALSARPVLGDAPAEAESDSLDHSPIAVDSTLSESPLPPPQGKVRYRSAPEELAALPGKIVLLPFFVLSEAGKKATGALWDQRFFDVAREWLTTEDGRAGVRPLGDTRIGTGARFFHRDLVGAIDADLTASFGRSARDRQRYHLVLGAPDDLVLPGQVSLVALYRREPGERFFGEGNDSHQADISRYLQRHTEARIDYRHRIGRSLAVNAEVGYRFTRIENARAGDDPDTRELYGRELDGLHGRAQLARGALAVRTTFVDVPGSPTRGNKTMARLGYSQSLNGAKLSHVSLTAVTEQFHELFYRRTLSVRLGTDWRFAPGSNAVPFYDLASVGGELFVRGFQRGRFRDRGAAFATATYRYPVGRFLDAALFYETGRTFRRVDELSLADWHASFGAGTRVWVPRGIVFELNFIRSSEEARVLFSFDTVF